MEQGHIEQTYSIPPSAPCTVDTQATEKEKKWTLPETVAKTRMDGGEHIGPMRYSWPIQTAFTMSYLRPVSIHLGLFSDDGERKNCHQVKLSHLQRLVQRGQATSGLQDAAEFTRRILIRFEALGKEIKALHRPVEGFLERWERKPETMLEELLLDAAFIVEQLLQYWEAGTRPTKVVHAARLYRNDLVLFVNQIPYVLLLELIKLVKIQAEAGDDVFLKRIAIGYIVAEEASEWLLASYDGPVRHLLHLVYLHLASTVERRRPAAPPQPPRRWGCCKALRRAHGTTTAVAPLDNRWWSHSMIPPARDLHTAGIVVRPPGKNNSKAMRRCLADVRLRARVLELQPLDLSGFDFRLLANLVALELEWGWESSRRLFLSYLVFISELVPSEMDSVLLETAGVLLGAQDGIVVELKPVPVWFLLNQLANFNEGGELHPHFMDLARELSSSYSLKRGTLFARSSC
ncbi:hypothetical protein PVAP13_2NG539200 [Panicum virgatum]|uniref:Uncharacterized protein n=2 Tax=Panicum virgatum TaxID=38727 RepID=A0A8T0VV62_PANVG|nr:hypothetical protein PVAP13_2NG539200 [Panicum virgatum]